jgi:hypothetical protein
VQKIDITPAWYKSMSGEGAKARSGFVHDFFRKWSKEDSKFGRNLAAMWAAGMHIEPSDDCVCLTASVRLTGVGVIAGALRDRLAAPDVERRALARAALAIGDGKRTPHTVADAPDHTALYVEREDTDESVMIVSAPTGESRRFFVTPSFR